jgi:Xaa-Pro aminopeptidase
MTDPTSTASTPPLSDDSVPNRQVPFSEAFKQFIPQDWAPYPADLPTPLEATQWTPSRRAALAERFPQDRIVIPAGQFKQRSNDTDYPFRPHTAFAYYTGLGTDHEPDAALIIEDEKATLFFHPRVPRTDPEFYASARYGEMWVGARPSLEEMSALSALPCADSTDLAARIAAPLPTGGKLRIIREADSDLTALVDAVRRSEGAELDAELATWVSEARLVKDAFEVAEVERACAASAEGFEAVVSQLGEAVRRGRGERWVEGVFGLIARHHGNAVGYDTIAAGADHACTLHWIRNDGDLAEGDLILLDAGVELDSLYTADITRTLPVSGRFSEPQRRVYDAVAAAQRAGFAAAKPGATFKEVHEAAIRVIAETLHEWGILPVSVEETLSSEGGQFRRWMVHGTSHHLGLDVHDCAAARREQYREGVLKPGMVLTVEPGLYFKSTDLLVPEELRGIGVRIEDDIVITEDGCRILSHHLPREADEVEEWMGRLMS